jgi:hypothetical protein
MKRREDFFYDVSKLTKEERKYSEKLRPVIEGLLTDLNKCGVLTRRTTPETRVILDVLKDKEKIVLAQNRLTLLFGDLERFPEFLKANEPFLEGEDLSYLYLFGEYFLFLAFIEGFKNTLLFYLKRGGCWRFDDNMTLGHFLRVLKGCSPEYGKLLEDELDLRLRNSYAHGLFRFGIDDDGSSPVLLCYGDLGDLASPRKVSVPELLEAVKRHNILHMTLVTTIADWTVAGRFG